MKVTVRLFARARDLAGVDTLTVEIASGATVKELRQTLAGRVPTLAGFVARCAVAVNEEYAQETDRVAEGAEIALIPPVSGG